MKRLHLHVNVEDLEGSIAFYSTLFGAAPGLRKADYAKWLLDDPRVNFAISRRGRQAGLDHVGIQVDSRTELEQVAERLKAAGRAVFEETEAACCYAVSDKAWTADPGGLAWETFHSTGALTSYGDDTIDSSDIPRLARQAVEAEETSAKRCCP